MSLRRAAARHKLHCRDTLRDGFERGRLLRLER